MLATVAAADSAKVQKKSTAFLYIAKRNHTLCMLYINRRVNYVFYSITLQGLSQDLETGWPKLGILFFKGHQCSQITTINIFIEIIHNTHTTPFKLYGGEKHPITCLKLIF